ncbi:hypothetical protein D3C87_1923180 [compost metagenome]
MLAEKGGEVFGGEIAVDRPELGRQPAIVAAGDLPEMLVGIDARLARHGGSRGCFGWS